MKHIEKTGVLIECGFLSNPSEEALLRSPIYQQKLCSAIAAGICFYLNA
jgi:N-acetylmuramoyl-L-alanine amidase